MTVAGATELQGRYAGPVSRLAAWLVDVAFGTVALALTVVAAAVVIDLLTGDRVTIRLPTAFGVPATSVWLALYLLVSWAVPGRTLGMAIFGLRVVRSDGTPVGWGHAALRVLTFPFSYACGLGLLGIVLGRRHRALHDVVADTVVVYDWLPGTHDD